MSEYMPEQQAFLEDTQVSDDNLYGKVLAGEESSAVIFDRLRSRWNTIVAASAAVLAVSISSPFDVEPAYATGSEIAVIGMPFDGKWAYSGATTAECGSESNQTSHPSCHEITFGDWATDLYASANTEVKLKVEGEGLSFTWDKQASGSCGQTRRVNVYSNERHLGKVHFTHLKDAASTDQDPTNGMTLGKIANLSCNPGGSGKHIHVELDNAGSTTHSCYSDHSTNDRTAGISVSKSSSIGILGAYNTGTKQRCESVPESPSPYTLARPAAANFNGALNVFTRGGDGQIYTQYWNGSSWTGFSSIGGDMVSDPAVIVNGSALNVFALNKDGQVYTKYNDGTSWTGWASLGGQTMRGNPKVLQYGGELDVFALGTDGHPYKNTWQPTSGWGGWTSLGNYMDSSPAPVVYNGELDVIMRGGDNVIYKDTWNGSTWGGFAAVGGCCLAGNPDVIPYGNQLDIWSNAPAPSNGLWKNTWNGSSWGGWVNMGSGLAGDPEVIQYGSDLNVFARGNDGQMYTRYWSAANRTWSDWASTDPNKMIAGDPTVVQSGTELDIFVTGTDGRTYKNTKQQGGNWGGFSALPG